MKLLRLSITINFTKMKEDNISKLGDYDVPFCEQQYTHGSCCISLFKFNSFDQFITPQTASNFRHLLSCGIIETNHDLMWTGIFKVEYPGKIQAKGQPKYPESSRFRRLLNEIVDYV